MSATRDKSQKFTFVYSNLYSIYKKGLKTENSVSVSAPPPAPAPVIRSYTPAELIGKRVPRPAVIRTDAESPIQSLKQNLQQLNELQARLRFMLKELEELIKE